MNNLSNERLEYVIGRLEHVADNVKFGNVSAAQELLQAADGLRELLALREAGKEAVAVVLVEEDTSEQHRVAWTVKGQNLTDGRHELYAAPQLPAVPDEHVRREVNVGGNTWVQCSKRAYEKHKADGKHVRELYERPQLPTVPDGEMLRRWVAFGRAMEKSGSTLPRHLIAETEAMIAAAPKPGSDNG